MGERKTINRGYQKLIVWQDAADLYVFTCNLFRKFQYEPSLDQFQRLPFLYDLEMNARLLAALPLLIGAELLVHQRLRVVVAQFVERNIIIEGVLPKFK